FDDMPSQMDFKSAKTNFIKAARTGKDTLFSWAGEAYSAKKLILDTLLPIAYAGLQTCGIDSRDVERLLGIIEARTKGRTGEQWQIANLRELKKRYKTDKSLVLLTKHMVDNQAENLPIHLWKDIDIQDIKRMPRLVKEIMTSHVLKLYEDDYVSMAKAIMEWNQIHHIPVENDSGELVGLLTWSYLESLDESVNFEQTTVADVMITDIISVAPDERIEKAQTILEKNQIGCLPIVLDKTMVGILSKSDFVS
ncbi:MAG: CBS domain-containing protein, partial [Bacteroidota bacterium]